MHENDRHRLQYSSQSLQGEGEDEVPQGTQQTFCFILKSNFFLKNLK